MRSRCCACDSIEGGICRESACTEDLNCACHRHHLVRRSVISRSRASRAGRRDLATRLRNH